VEVTRLIEKTDKDFFFKMRLTVKNASQQDMYFQDGVEVSLGTLALSEKNQFPMLTFNHYTANNTVESLDYKKITGEQEIEEMFQWAGIQNSNYCSILSETESLRAVLWKHEKDSKSISGSASTEDFSLAPDQEKVFNFNYYLGPKLYFHLESLNLSFEQIIDYGAILGGITKPLVLFLNYLQGICGSYGFAILIMTLCFKIVTYPLTKKAIVSSTAMQVLQPEMKRLQEKHKSDPKQLQMAMMQLYKDNKVNPMSGCFPILIQMPIFIAFFKALSTSVELHGSSFWLIQDLALPDRLIPLGTFSINVLPLILAVTQWVSSKQSITDPAQKKMILFMTIFLTFIFYTMPSGLNLYFLASNLVGIAQTSWIKKRIHPKTSIKLATRA
jgi:YidC/Oxa1 family membrane protein insertase